MRARPNSAALKKRKRFLGRPNFAHARALCEMARADGGASSQPSLFAAARAGPAQPRNNINKINKTDKNNLTLIKMKRIIKSEIDINFNDKKD